MSHLIFFDGECPFCQNAVRRIYKWDQKKCFLFAPLQGKTAKVFFKETFEEKKKKNTLVLIENYKHSKAKVWMYGRGACRIFWLLGGKWKAIGWPCFLPFGCDFFYKIIAHHRYSLSKKASLSLPEDRTLP